ncbi:MAG: cobalamin biosynthesis protein [Actinomycetota bacterium]
MGVSGVGARASGLLVGYLADCVLGDPQRYHPVAGFGRLAKNLERVTYRDSRAVGGLHEVLLVGGVVGTGLMLTRLVRGPTAHAAAVAVATWIVLGGRSLAKEATAVHDLLVAGDVPAARTHLTRLVGRNTDCLDESGIARAVVESVAENTSDAVIAPLLWGTFLGPVGLLGYRAINTLDAMIGYRNPRYEKFGWAAARLDDVVNLPGSRLTGVLAMVAKPRQARAIMNAWRRDARRHPSPNAGVVEAAFAAALDLQLGGVNSYDNNRVEHRGTLGCGRPPMAEDIPAAIRLARVVSGAAVLVAAVIAWGSSRRGAE